jgi:hypothetical protein
MWRAYCDEGTREDPRRDVKILLERLQKTDADLRRLGDLVEADTSQLALSAEGLAEGHCSRRLAVRGSRVETGRNSNSIDPQGMCQILCR